MTKQPRPQKLLILSDIHIGNEKSSFPEYQLHMLELMSHYDHVVLDGDCIELLYVGKNHIKDLTKLLVDLTGKDSKYWENEFKKPETARNAVENVINGTTLFTAEFLQLHPKVHLYIVGGNHESIRRFHNELDVIQKYFSNFEWSPQAIRIGDALFTHGHLPLYGKTFDQYPIGRLRDSDKNARWTRLVNSLADWEHGVNKKRNEKEPVSHRIEKMFTQWEKKGEFLVSHNRKHETLDMKWVKHIISGHTHVRFDNYQPEGSNILQHNAGAMMKHVAETGVLEADLNADGTVTNVRPVKLSKDKKLFLPPSIGSGAMTR